MNFGGDDLSWGPSIDPRWATAGELMFLLLALLDFAVMFMAGFFNAHSFRKCYLESGEIDWQEYRQLRLRSLGYVVVGAILVPFGLSSFVTNVGPLTLSGLRVNFAIELIFFLVALFGGLGFLGSALGFGIGSLVSPVKKVQQIDKP